MTPTTTESAPTYDPAALLQEDGPLNPSFMQEAIRTLLRALPLDPTEPQPSSDRRMYSALLALTTLHPRDEIEVMIGVQALSAYHAAAACWRIGMNHHRPNGDSTRHVTTAASAARTFDTLLKALERRQAKPLAIPPGRPAPRQWAPLSPGKFIQDITERCSAANDDPGHQPPAAAVWTTEALAITDQVRDHDRIEDENQGLDIAATPGILPGGGMILPEDPTPHQAAYIGRRLGLMYKREYHENLRQGLKVVPKIRPIRPGDLIP